jgi:arylformamidase
MRFIDLSHPLTNEQHAFPGDPVFRVREHSTIDSESRCNISHIEMGSHQGTHLDSMFHFIQNGKTLDQMPLGWFYGAAHVLQIPKQAGEELDVEDFLPFEGVLLPEAKIIYQTGWSSEFKEPYYFTDFPSLTIAACQFLAGKGIRLLGMDTPTPSRDYYESHQILLEQEIVIVESLTNLELLPNEFIFCGFPLNFVGRDGSPIRAVGIVP